MNAPGQRGGADAAASESPARPPRTPFVRTGLVVAGIEPELRRLYDAARIACPDAFIAEETRELHAAYSAVSLGFVDTLKRELARLLAVPEDIFSRDRFSMHGCSAVGLHDDFFRFPGVYFVIVVVHSGVLGLVTGAERARRHVPGEVILLDPRGKHALVPEGLTAEEHPYDSSHRPEHDEARQFMFLDFDVRRPNLRARFRAPSASP